ncbi:MAG: hypothetical protein ABIN69_09205 [Aestuariivirga sp.]
MNTSIFEAYSNIYSVAMMRNVKSTNAAPVAPRSNEPRFSSLVKLFRRA